MFATRGESLTQTGLLEAAFRVFQDLDHLDVALHGVSKDVSDNGRIVFSQYWEFFGNEGPDPHILKPDGVQHAGRGFTQPGAGGAFHRFPGEAFGDEAAETIQVNKVGEFKAVTEGSAGRENRIPQAQRANLYAEVHGGRLAAA